MNDERIILTDRSKIAKSQQRGELIIHKFPFRIGRKQSGEENPFHSNLRENDFYLEEEKRPYHASRNHVEIGFSGGAVYIRDLGSANGILVNGMRVGGGHGAPATLFLDKQENTIQVGKNKSPWLFDLKIPLRPERYRLLIADDDDDMRAVTSALFEDEYEIIQAVDGEEALELFLKEQPDIALLDWEMPKMEGVQVCKHLKTNLRTSSTPIVMLTGRNETPDRIVGIVAGADDYVMKPPDFEDLKTRVNAALARSLRARNVHWLTGVAAEAAFREEVDAFLGSKTMMKEFELIAVTLRNLGAMQEASGLRLTDILVQNVAESLWSETLRVERTVVGQIRLGQWGILTPTKNRRFVEKSIKAAIGELLRDTLVSSRITSYATGKCSNYYSFSGII